MHRVSAIASTLALVAFMCALVYNSAIYEREVGGHLKLAADANSIELAERKLTRAVNGMDKLDLCSEGGNDCYTSVLWRVPEDDIAYWRENIESTLSDLNSMTPEQRADNLTESNQLIKVRETLVDNGESGTYVTSPNGIANYPHNRRYFLAGWVLLLLWTGSLGWWFWKDFLKDEKLYLY